MFACQSLLHSDIGAAVNWILLDSTAATNLGATLFVRMKRALWRVLNFIRFLVTKKVDAALIFTAEGLSFVEKGLMALMAHYVGKKVILAPRSGVVVRDISKSNFMRWYIPFILKRVDIVICQSKIWKDFYFQLQPDRIGRYVVIENWLDIKNYTQVKPALMTNDKVSIIFLAWVEKSKGILDLIEAMNIVQKNIDRNKIELNIYGHGKDFDETARLIHYHGLSDICHLRGWIRGSEKLKALQCSDIYVLPTYFEGFPNSLMEAMAVGLPSIATIVGSIPDIIEDGYSGMLINAGSAEALAGKIVTLLNDEKLRRYLGANARKRIVASNTIEEASQRFRMLFEKLHLSQQEAVA